MKHYKARNCTERAFGIIKMWWAILLHTTWFPVDVGADIVNACCLLHNFIKREQGVDVFERLYASTEHANVTNLGVVEDVESILTIQLTAEWTQFRIAKAQEM
ncbi:hypothetical protein LINPERHAP2_LOCUS40208 [Linum perenne]